MRLIDADRLKTKITGITKPHEFVEEIDKRPTVKAIPIEWLKTQIEKCQEISNTSKTVALAILTETIKQWEKENE